MKSSQKFLILFCIYTDDLSKQRRVNLCLILLMESFISLTQQVSAAADRI